MFWPWNNRGRRFIFFLFIPPALMWINFWAHTMWRWLWRMSFLCQERVSRQLDQISKSCQIFPTLYFVCLMALITTEFRTCWSLTNSSRSCLLQTEECLPSADGDGRYGEPCRKVVWSRDWNENSQVIKQCQSPLFQGGDSFECEGFKLKKEN